VAVDRDAGVEEAWIFFAGDEEEGGKVGEDGSTCSKVRFGIRKLISAMEGKDASSCVRLAGAVNWTRRQKQTR
jgi:hypothetical protein